MFDALSQDMKYGVRSMRKHPVFTIVAILSLALGIGGNAAMFSLVNTLLLTKLPVRDPDALYQLIVTHRSATHNSFSYPDFQKLRDGFQIFEGVIAWSSRNFEVHLNEAPLQVHGAVVTGNFYDVLGVKAAAGRLLTVEDDVPGGNSVVIGYGFWQRSFGHDPQAIGKVIRVQGIPMTIVGVTAPEFGGAENRSSQRHHPSSPRDENPVSTIQDFRGDRGVLDAHHGSTQARHDYGVSEARAPSRMAAPA